MNEMRIHKDREKFDLKTLLIVAVTIPTTWLLFLGWKPSLSVATQDAGMILLPYVRELVARPGSWQTHLFRADLLGGIVTHDVLGGFPIFRWCASLGFGPIATLNSLSFLIQLLIVFSFHP